MNCAYEDVVPADLRVLSVELLDERLGVTVAAV